MKRKNYNILSVAKQGLFAAALLASSVAHSQLSYTISYTGAVQTITLPAGPYMIETWGANGGDINAVQSGGGKGGYSKGIYVVTSSGTPLYFFVGGKGANAPGDGAPSGDGGWNGGGGGGYVIKSAGGGGGATDVRVGGTAAANRIIVAGGGGGGAFYNLMAKGGNGGGQTGQNGDFVSSANVYSVGMGGPGANGATPGIGLGNNAVTNGSASGGGGGGWSGGGAGTPGTGGGAGGFGGYIANGSNGSSGGGGGGYAGGAGGNQATNAGVAGGGGSGYAGGVINGTTLAMGDSGYVFNPVVTGNGLIIIREYCDVEVFASNNPICEGESLTLSTNAGSNIQWSAGGTTQSITVSPAVTTVYTFTGTSSNYNCTAAKSIIVYVNPLPVLSFQVQPNVLCEGGTGTIVASGAASYVYDSGAPTGNTFTANPAATTVYTVTGTSASGCSNTSTVALNVNTNQLTMSPDTTVCEGSPAYLRANGAVSYSWNVGAPFQNVTIYPTSTTVYSVSAIDEHNCALGGSVFVVVNPRPTVSVGASHSVVCRGEPVQLFADGASSYKWSNGESGATISPDTKYDLPLNITVTGTDDKGCSSTASITVIISACVAVDEEETVTFRLMPNPASTEVTIESQNEAKWTITDLAGRTVLQGDLQKGSQTVDVSTLSSGVYLVRLQTAQSARTVRLIKN